MLVNGITVLGLVALAALLARAARWAWGSKRAWLKWSGLTLATLLTLVVDVVLVILVMGLAKGYLPASNPVSNARVAGTPEQVARGKQLAYVCVSCHSPDGDLPLAGGQRNFGDFGPGGPTVGALYAPNLTPAGELAGWSDGEILRALREGVHKNGRSLLIMTSDAFHSLSDEDAQSLVAYLRLQPAVPRDPHYDTPSNGVNPLGAMLIGLGMFPTSAQPPITQPVVAPPRGPTAEYGKYLVDSLGCHDCHGANLTGGRSGGPTGPVAPNLTLTVPRMAEADLLSLFRTGTVGGNKISDNMPWNNYGRSFTDDDVQALYAFLHGLTPTQAASK
ncbi:MAG: c-type cytochrome [Anaerolineae bacterium]